MLRRAQAFQLRGGGLIVSFLQIAIDEILDRVAELIPDELSVIAGRIS
jgi:hypothetical protein